MTRSGEFSAQLKDGGLKATPQRLKVLALLHASPEPIGIPEILANSSSEGLDTVTIYRSLEALVSAGMVRRVDVRHGHADYELVQGEHHHHLVCEGCGRMEDIEWCPNKSFQANVLKGSSFTQLTDHSMEFFGICKKCSHK